MEPKLFGDLEPEPKNNFCSQFGGCLDEEKLISTSIIIEILKWQYMAVAGAGAEIIDKVRAGAENK